MTCGTSLSCFDCNSYVDLFVLQHEHDIIASLIGQSYRDGRPLRDHEMAHIMIGLLMAGQHTSAATGSWALLRLAANPGVA